MSECPIHSDSLNAKITKIYSLNIWFCIHRRAYPAQHKTILLTQRKSTASNNKPNHAVTSHITDDPLPSPPLHHLRDLCLPSPIPRRQTYQYISHTKTHQALAVPPKQLFLTTCPSLVAYAKGSCVTPWGIFCCQSDLSFCSQLFLPLCTPSSQSQPPLWFLPPTLILLSPATQLNDYLFLGLPEESTTVAQTTEIYLLIALEAASLRSRCQKIWLFLPSLPLLGLQMDALLLCPYMAFPLMSLGVSEFPILVIQIKHMDTKWGRGADEWKYKD